MLIWTTAGLTRLATLMNTRESSAGEGSWAEVSAPRSFVACYPEAIAGPGACEPEIFAPSGAC